MKLVLLPLLFLVSSHCFLVSSKCSAPVPQRQSLYFVEKKLLSFPSIMANESLWCCFVVATCNSGLTVSQVGLLRPAAFSPCAFQSHCLNVTHEMLGWLSGC